MIIKMETFIHSLFFLLGFTSKSECHMFFLSFSLHLSVHCAQVENSLELHTRCLSTQIKLHPVNLGNHLCWKFQRSMIRNAQCVSTENSIKFGIDQSILRQVIGWLHRWSLHVCVCAHCNRSTLFPVTQLSERVNFSRKICVRNFQIVSYLAFLLCHPFSMPFTLGPLLL